MRAFPWLNYQKSFLCCIDGRPQEPELGNSFGIGYRLL